MTKASAARIKRRKNPRLASDNRIVHFLVKKTAQELAGCYYEWQATMHRRGDDFYKAYPSVDAFVENDWPNFVKTAKQTMAEQLADPMVPDHEKEQIYEALTLDATMPWSQQEVQITNFPH